MNGKTTLKRLEGLARRRPQATFAEYEQAKLDAMTDDELARQVDALAQVLRTLNDAGALGDVLDRELLAAAGAFLSTIQPNYEPLPAATRTTSARAGTPDADARRTAADTSDRSLERRRTGGSHAPLRWAWWHFDRRRTFAGYPVVVRV